MIQLLPSSDTLINSSSGKEAQDCLYELNCLTKNINWGMKEVFSLNEMPNINKPEERVFVAVYFFLSLKALD